MKYLVGCLVLVGLCSVASASSLKQQEPGPRLAGKDPADKDQSSDNSADPDLSFQDGTLDNVAPTENATVPDPSFNDVAADLGPGSHNDTLDNVTGNSTELDGDPHVHEGDASLELIALSEELAKMVSEAARALTEALPTADGGAPAADVPTSSDGVSRKKRMVSGSEEDNSRKYKTKRFFPGLAEGIVQAERNFVNAEEALLGYRGFDDGYGYGYGRREYEREYGGYGGYGGYGYDGYDDRDYLPRY